MRTPKQNDIIQLKDDSICVVMLCPGGDLVGVRWIAHTRARTKLEPSLNYGYDGVVLLSDIENYVD